MSAAPGDPREAAERTVRALVAGNLAQVMADLAPEAMAQLMQLTSGAQGVSLSQMPTIERFELEELAAADGEARFLVRVFSPVGSVAVETRWRPILGQWKVAGIALAGVEAGDGTGTAGG